MGSCLFQGKLKEHRHHGSNPYWHQLSLIYDQLEGLEHGYDDKAMREKVEPTYLDVFLLSDYILTILLTASNNQFLNYQSDFARIFGPKRISCCTSIFLLI